MKKNITAFGSLFALVLISGVSQAQQVQSQKQVYIAPQKQNVVVEAPVKEEPAQSQKQAQSQTQAQSPKQAQSQKQAQVQVQAQTQGGQREKEVDPEPVHNGGWLIQ